MSDNKENLIPVLVTTTSRGVFFGYLADNNAPGNVTLLNTCNVIYWHQEVRGFLGLAVTGPSENCKIGPTASGRSTLYGVTGIFECSQVAARRFKERSSNDS